MTAIELLEENWFFQNPLSGGQSITMESSDVNNAVFINYKVGGDDAQNLETGENNNDQSVVRLLLSENNNNTTTTTSKNNTAQMMDGIQEEGEGEEEETVVISKPKKKNLLRCYTSLDENVGARTSSSYSNAAPHIKGRHHQRKLSADKIAQKFFEDQRADNVNLSPTKPIHMRKMMGADNTITSQLNSTARTDTPAMPSSSSSPSSSQPKPNKKNLLRCYTSLAGQKVDLHASSSRDGPPIRHSQSPHKSGSKQQRPPRDGTSTEIGTSRHDRRRQQMQRNHPVHKDENFERFVDMRKWKSFSDLEHEEVQGFKDLGFVFDNSTGVSKELLNVIPGLREKDEGEKSPKRPSEAWLLERSMPSIQFQSGNVDVKEKLRFWARAVASNVKPKS